MENITIITTTTWGRPRSSPTPTAPPFGRPYTPPSAKPRSSPPPPVASNLRFPGQYFDAETGLHYNFFRYYCPDVGRYLKTDPIGYNGGINLFIYAENSPQIFFDSFGLISGWDLDAFSSSPGDHFNTLWGAQLAAVRYVREKGAYWDIEWSATINRTDCGYTYNVWSGDKDSVLARGIHVYTVVIIHNHPRTGYVDISSIGPKWIPKYKDGIFSDTDLDVAKKYCLISILVRPDDKNLIYNPYTEIYYELGNENPYDPFDVSHEGYGE